MFAQAARPTRPARPARRPRAAKIAAQNARTDSSLRLALNEFADLTWEEFTATRLGYKSAKKQPRCGRGAGGAGGALWRACGGTLMWQPA